MDADELKAEYESVTPDTTFLNTRRGVVQNKNAIQLCIGDNEHRQCPNIQEGRAQKSFEDLPSLRKFAQASPNRRGKDTPKIMNLLAEANIYHHGIVVLVTMVIVSAKL